MSKSYEVDPKNNGVGRYGQKELVKAGTHEHRGKLSFIDLIFTNKTGREVGTGNETIGTHHHC